ncbi:hypothetical protein Ddye_025314 [Dipteronia dyeriana]|uniref:Uncharacterized protein n=1 Tax=Dipteronia dyeriana TaxID=168575 RepID=A0AAD9TX03_9ROSI|nr:hypothetical protein Ddye_025314 [Dipteronia dyeriana]
MEEHKIRYLQHFLRRTLVSMEDFLIFIKNNEEKLRNSYSETIKLSSNDFVEMILLDAVFLLEVLSRRTKPRLRTTDDRIFSKPNIILDVESDIWSIENQLPLFILENLFKLAKTSMAGKHYEGLSLINLTSRFFMPAGVKFKLGSTEHLLDIRFSKLGTLEIPMLKIGSVSGYLLFGNLLVFERLHCTTNYINDYIKIISCLVNAPKDAQLLIQNGVIKNRTWEGEGMSTLLNNLSKNARVQFFNSNYSDLVEELDNYCKSPWNKWKANLKQNYFNTPWASISVIAAAILLMLTFVQAVCSIISAL